MIVCPNFKSKEWIELATELGSAQAMKVYRMNDSDIPSILYAKELLANGVTSYTDNIDPITHNDNVSHKIVSDRFTVVNEFVDMITSEDIKVTDTSINIGGYVIKVDTLNNTRETLDNIIAWEQVRLKDEQEILTKQLNDLSHVDTKSQEYKDVYPHHSATDLNDNPIGITDTPVNKGVYSPAKAYDQAAGLVKAFEKVGIYTNVTYDFTSPNSGDVIAINGVAQIRINPIMMKQDSIYHEFGHIYVDMIGYNTPFIQSGIAQVINTKLADAIRLHYPNLNKEQFEKEVLTTAIGMATTSFINNPESRVKWNFWINRLYRAMSDLLNKITNGKFGNKTDVAKSLAADLINQKIGKKLLGNLSTYRQQQIEIPKFLTTMINTGVNRIDQFQQEQRARKAFYSTKREFASKTEETISAIELSKIGIQDNLNEFIKTLSFSLNYDLKNSQSLINRLNIYYDKLVDSNTDTGLAHMNGKERQGILDALRGTRDFMASFAKIDKIRDITSEQIKSLNDIHDKTTDQTERDKLFEYITFMDDYTDKIETVKDKIEFNRRVLSQKFHDLNPKVAKYIMQKYSTNPEIMAIGEDAIIKLVEDEGFFAANFDSWVKSIHPVLANMGLIVQTQLAIKDQEVKRLNQPFYATYKKAHDAGFTNSDILDDLNMIVRQYDYVKLNNDLRTALEGLNKDDEGFGNTYFKFMSKNTKRAINETTGSPYTDNDLNNIIDNKFKTLTSDEYDVWYNRTFKTNNKGEHMPRMTSEYVTLLNYVQDKWNTIQSKPILKEYYDTVYNIFKETGKDYDELLLNGFLPAIPNEGFQKELDKRKDDVKDPIDEIHYINSSGEAQDRLSIQYAGYLNALPLIEIHKQLKDVDGMEVETDEEYETRELARINDSGGSTEGRIFTSLKEVEQENANRKVENLKRHAAAVSTDLFNVIPMWVNSALTYRYKKNIESEILLGTAIIKDTPINKRTISGKLKLGANNKPLEVSGETSYTYKHAVNAMAAHFYGKTIIPSKYDTLLKGAKNYVSFLGMGFNIFANVKNITQGGFMTAAEAFDGTFYNMKEDMLYAEKEYDKAIPSFFGDVQLFKKGVDPLKASTWVNALIKQFPIIKSFNDLMERNEDEGHNLAYFKHMITSVAFFGQEAGEHMMQNKTFLAMAHSHRLMMINGRPQFVSLFDYTNLKIKQTDVHNKTPEENAAIIKENVETRKTLKAEFEQGTRVTDIFDFSPTTGYLTFKNEFIDEHGEKAMELAMAQFQLRAIAVNHKIHGVYDSANRGTIERTTFGQLGIQFRKWARPGWTKRFGYRGGAFRIMPAWDESTHTENVGSYKALGKFLFTQPISNKTKEMFASHDAKTIARAMMNMVTDYGKFITSVKVQWHMLTPVEQAAARNAAAEFAAMGITMALLIGGLKYRDKDDKRKHDAWLNFRIYQLDAAFKELTSYVPIVGWLTNGKQILANPAATWGLMNTVGTVVGDLVQYPFQTPNQRVFDGGFNDKQSKLWTHVKQGVPGANVLLRFHNQAAGQFRAYNLGNIKVTAGSNDNTTATNTPTN